MRGIEDEGGVDGVRIGGGDIFLLGFKERCLRAGFFWVFGLWVVARIEKGMHSKVASEMTAAGLAVVSGNAGDREFIFSRCLGFSLPYFCFNARQPNLEGQSSNKQYYLARLECDKCFNKK